MHLTLLGPQRRPTVDQVLPALDPEAPLATVTAGWQEREPDDGELDALLGGRTVNLKLYGRWLDVRDRDPGFASAEAEHRTALEELRTLHLVQLDSALTALDVMAQRSGERPQAVQEALADAEAVVRLLDDRHLARVVESNRTFEATFPPHERPVIAEHRAAVERVLQQVGALVVAGGHVAVLLRNLQLFDVAPFVPQAVVAWSAGAMALTDRVVLFHDRTAQGPSPVEIYDDGLGLIPGLVLLPHARRRLRVDEPARLAALARRFAPARCVVLDDESRLDLEQGGELPAAARVIDAQGRITSMEAR
ncbi:MAG: hypothetical protein ACR2JU_13095 [Nocardioidaceae bacterium]